MRKLLAEAIGTFWLVLGGCGAALVAAGVPDVGIGFAGVSLAFGLTVLTMAVAIGHISLINHDPEPNCEWRMIQVHDRWMIEAWSIRRLARGEELTFDYGSTFFPLDN